MELIYGNNELRIAGGNYKAFDIKYRGLADIEVVLSDNWVCNGNEKRIIGVSLGPHSDELIIKYDGRMRILSCSIVDENNEKRLIRVVDGNKIKPEQIHSTWDTVTADWDSFKSNEVVRNIYKPETSIIQTNLEAKEGEWFLYNGTPYYGPYHIHVSDKGQAMTGAKHTRMSEEIYRKTNTGELFDTKSKSFLKRFKSSSAPNINKLVRKIRKTSTGGY